MQKKLLIIADPLHRLNLATDSSLALAEISLEEGHTVFWCEIKDIYYGGMEIYVNKPVQLTEISTTKLTQANTKQQDMSFAEFDYCFIRKDPPFDEAYKDLCWILSTQTKVKIINPPELLLAYHEKSLHWRALSEGFLTEKQVIPTCLSSSPEIIKDFCIRNKSLFTDGYICKPWLGHGGKDVNFFADSETLFRFLQTKVNQLVLVQPFLKQISSEGDRRVLFANGEILGDYVRLPQKGKIASNVGQGGRAVLVKMNPEQIEICLKIGKFLKAKSIAFAGLDLISQYVGEINITSPTGLRTFESLTGQNIARKAFHLMVS